MTGTSQKMSVSPCLGGNLDITLGNKTDVLVPVKARRGGKFQGEFKNPGEFVRQCFPQWIMTHQWVKTSV